MKTIALLYPGDMGTAVGRRLAAAGFEVVTHVADRSETTRRNAADAGFACATHFADAVSGADLVISLATPDAAVDLARRFAATLGTRKTRRDEPPIYLDANNVSPPTMHEIAAIVSQAGATCVDGGLIGTSSMVGGRTLLLLSGPAAGLIERHLRGSMRIKLLDDEVGAASAVRLSVSWLTKGLPALFLEMVSAAGKAGKQHELIQVLRDLYPGLMELLERTLPTYPRHVARRLQEIDEMERWVAELGLQPVMPAAVRTMFSRFEAAGIEPDRRLTFDEIVAEVARRGLRPKTPGAA